MVAIKQKIKDFFKDDLSSKMIALLFAMAVWLYLGIQNPDMTKTYWNIGVDVKNENSSGLSVVSNSTSRVSVTVEGKKDSINSITGADIEAWVDISNIKNPGEYSLPVQVSVPIDGATEIITPSKITVVLDRIITKQVPVKVSVQNNLPEDYILGSYTPKPETIEVQGAEAVVTHIEYAQAEIVLADERSSYTAQTEYKFYTADGAEYKTSNVTVSSKQVSVDIEILKTKEVPLSVDFINNIYSSDVTITHPITPETITVAGPEEAIDRFNSLTVGTVDLSKVDGEQEFTFMITLPSGIQNVNKLEFAKVKVTVETDITKYVTIHEMTLQNIPEGMSAEVLSTSLEIRLRGSTSAVNGVTESNIQASVDLAGIQAAAGEYEVPVTVAVTGVDNVLPAGDYTVRVRVFETTTEATTEPEQ